MDVVRPPGPRCYVIAPVLVALMGVSPTLGAVTTTPVVGARSELRVRAGSDAASQTAGEGQGVDLDNTATLGLDFAGQPSRFSVVYAPRFVLTNFAGQQRTQDFLQGLDLLLALPSRSYTLTLAHHLEYGSRRFSALDAPKLDPMTRRPVTTVVPAPASILYAASVTTAGLRLGLTRRSDLAITASYGVSGGVDEESRRTLPLIAGPRLDALWSYGLNRRDTLGTGLTASWTRSLGSAQTKAINSGFVTLGERWDRVWRRELRSSLLLGAGVLIQPKKRVRPLPQAFGTLTRSFPGGAGHSTFELSLGAGTSVEADPLTGTTRPNVGATGQAAWVAYPFRAYALGGAMRMLETTGAETATNGAITVFMADVGASYNVAKSLVLDLGFRFNDQQVDSPSTNLTAASGATYAAFFAVGWRPTLAAF
jgi:hypothetical protein